MTQRLPESVEKAIVAYGVACRDMVYLHATPESDEASRALEAAILAAIESEREACAKVADSFADILGGKIARAIRARAASEGE